MADGPNQGAVGTPSNEEWEAIAMATQCGLLKLQAALLRAIEKRNKDHQSGLRQAL